MTESVKVHRKDQSVKDFTSKCLLLPANEVCEGYVFTGVCLSTPGGGMHGFSPRGARHAWFYSGDMHGFIWGACVVLFRGVCMVLFRGHAWFLFIYLGGMCGFIWGCVCGFSGGHVWFFWGGMHGFFSFSGYNEIRSMSSGMHPTGMHSCFYCFGQFRVFLLYF